MTVTDELNESLAGKVVDDLHRLTKTVSSYEEGHPVTKGAVQALIESIQQASPPMSLQFVGEAVYRDYDMIPLDLERFERVGKLTTALYTLGYHEITFEDGITESEVVDLGSALARGAMGATDALDFFDLRHIKWRDIPNISWGDETEEVDPETYCAAQLTLALMDTESISRDPEEPWPWTLGLNVVRRLENAVGKSPHRASWAAETAPGEWTADRRALNAALHVQRLLSHVGTSTQVARATVPATLALSTQGFQGRSACSMSEAASSVFDRIVQVPDRGRVGVEPHRLRVCALFHRLDQAGDDRSGWFGPHHLIHMAYELERGRWPDELERPLSLVDLLADAVLTRGERFSPKLLQLLISATGVLPPGTKVQLDDGRTGTVIGPEGGEDPWRPLVMVDGALMVPTTAVSPLTAVNVDD